jgi:spermidine synthase
VSIFLDERPDGNFALFIDGDLQFDTADEALYHESLALPALCLAKPENPGSLRLLICGGGDGLALRECLRFPSVTHVDLVDYSPEIVDLGRTRFAELNNHSFEDPRVKVHIQDAWEFLSEAPTYDVILCDFTVPRRPGDDRVFTQEWYQRLQAVLTPGGIISINGVSPQTTPEAFWCVNRTLGAASLFTLPYRSCIPSFRTQGYGVWAFFLAAHRQLLQSELKGLECPVSTRQVDMAKLWRGARFSRADRAAGSKCPVNTLESSVLLPLLLNPRMTDLYREALSQPDSAAAEPYDLDPLLKVIPVVHPYHTREMVETLAQQVAGGVRSLDLRKLVDALLVRAARLPSALVTELGRLKEFIRGRADALDAFRSWSTRLFAALVITMTLANAIAPDNAFAKGGSGIGHSSMSRGFAGGFGGGRGGFSTSGRAGSAGGGSTGGFRGGASPHINGGGFRSSNYGGSHMTDIYGYTYAPRIYVYGGGYGHHTYYHGSGGHTSTPSTPPEQHKALFVADEDMLVMDNGDVIITLSDTAYLLLSGGNLSFMCNKLPDPLVPLYPDPALIQRVTEELKDQQVGARQAVGARRDWLGWVGWTSALFSSVSDDKAEVRNLEDLARRIDTALTRIGPAKSGQPEQTPVPGNPVELFVNGYLLDDGRIAFRGLGNHMVYTDGKMIWQDDATVKKTPCPPEMAAALKSIMAKLQKELAADVASDDNDLRQLTTDSTNLKKDLAEYQSIQLSNLSDPDYEVDYGTESIRVGDAISRTETDIRVNEQDYKDALAEKTKSATDLERINSIYQTFGK